MVNKFRRVLFGYQSNEGLVQLRREATISKCHIDKPRKGARNFIPAFLKEMCLDVIGARGFKRSDAKKTSLTSVMVREQ